MTLTCTLGANLNVGSGVTLRPLPSTAAPGVDYTSPTSGTITFPAATPSGTVFTLPVVTAPNSTPSVAKTHLGKRHQLRVSPDAPREPWR